MTFASRLLNLINTQRRQFFPGFHLADRKRREFNPGRLREGQGKNYGGEALRNLRAERGVGAAFTHAQKRAGLR